MRLVTFPLLIIFLCSCQKTSQQDSKPNPWDENRLVEIIKKIVPEMFPDVLTPPILPPLGFVPDSRKTGNKDTDTAVCPLDNPDSDGDGVCDSDDRCPGFDDTIDPDADGSPGQLDAGGVVQGCDCDPNDPAVFPGFPCKDNGSVEDCFSLLCDPELSGQCLSVARPAMFPCGFPPQDRCDALDTCDGLGNCIDNKADEGTICGTRLDGPCDAADTCDGLGTCIDNKQDTDDICQPKTNECTLATSCDGVDDACPAPQFTDDGSACGLDSDGSCDGQGDCDRAFFCPGAVTPAERADNDNDNYVAKCDCDDNDPAIFPGSACQSDDNDCTQDICDPALSGTCLHTPLDLGTFCGDEPTGECDAEDYCDGEGNCQENFAPEGSFCGDVPTEACDEPDACDGMGDCIMRVASTTTICRQATSQCQQTEFCDGESTTCPADSYAPVGTACGEAVMGLCDLPDTCNEEGVCQANFRNNQFVCRPAKDECDQAESCTGDSVSCPSDATQPDGTVCGMPPSPQAFCDLQNTCVSGECQDNIQPQGTVCRASIDENCNTITNTLGYCCDPAETCDGVSKTCPDDTITPDGNTQIACNTLDCVGPNAPFNDSGELLCVSGESLCYSVNPNASVDVCFGQFPQYEDNKFAITPLGIGASVSLDDVFSIVGAPQSTNKDGLLAGASLLYQLNPNLNNTWDFVIPEDIDADSGSITDPEGNLGGAIFSVLNSNAGFSVGNIANYYLVGSTQSTVNIAGILNAVSAGVTYTYRGTTSLSVFSNTEPNIDADYGHAIATTDKWVLISDSKSSKYKQDGGEVIIYKFSGVLTYFQSIFPDDLASDDQFGTSVSISPDNSWILAGSPQSDGPDGNDFLDNNDDDRGAAYFFNFDESQNMWVQNQAVVQEPFAANNNFGASVAVDGSSAVIGVPGSDTGSESNAGAVCFYRFSNNSWFEEGCIAGQRDSLGLGTAVAIQGQIAYVGAPSTSFDTEGGRVYIYQDGGSNWQEIVNYRNPFTNEISGGDQFGISIAADSNWFAAGAPSATLTNIVNGQTTTEYFNILYYFFPSNALTNILQPQN